MSKGRIKNLVGDRGFGFIAPNGGGPDLFFHANELQGAAFEELRVGMQVEFRLAQGEKGPKAVQVRVISSEAARPAATTRSPDAAPQKEARQYRFYNPYNFVRLLPPPDRGGDIPPPVAPQGGLAAALQDAGLSVKSTAQSSATDRQLLARCRPPTHDRFVGWTGEITCELTAMTPLFVADAHGVQLHGEHKSFEFFKLDGRPAIPPSSLRGMVRSVFEAATNSCMPSFTDDVMTTRLSTHVRPQEALKLVPARVEKSDGAWTVRLLPGATAIKYGQPPSRGQPQYAAWIPRYLGQVIQKSRNLAPTTEYGRRRNAALHDLQHGEQCWAVLEKHTHPRGFQFWSVVSLHRKRPSPSPDGNRLVAEGFLCINNQNIENKHDERFFFNEKGLQNATCLALSDDVLKDYDLLIQDYKERHSEEIEKWKKKDHDPQRPWGKKSAFSRFICEPKARKLKPKELVYVQLSNGGQVEYLAPVSIPRVMYHDSLGDCLPHGNDEDRPYHAACKPQSGLDLCPACRTFGWTAHQPKNQDEHAAWRSRVDFTTARLEGDAKTLPSVPLAILSSPKPTTVRMYLRPRHAELEKVWRGDSADAGYDGKTNQLRGRKFYRHHGQAREEEYVRKADRRDDQNRTVRDPLAPGARFTFTVSFRNLAPVELGALLWSLELGRMGCHRLGYAKPLGFGAIEVRVRELRLLDAEGLRKRYTSLQQTGWAAMEEARWSERFVARFQTAMAELYAAPSFEELAPIVDLRILSNAPKDDLPVHYPRTSRVPDPEGKNFEWFIGNKRKQQLALQPPAEDEGLPLIRRDGKIDNQ